MKILLAAPDRDLLECEKQLLEDGEREIVTAFDGTQVLSMLQTESFDIVILDRDIPRIDHRRIISRIKEIRIPVIVLTDSRASVSQLTEEALPNTYLSYPFTSEKLTDVIQNTLDEASSDDRFDFFGVGVDASEFKIADGPYLTADEIRVMKTLLRGGRITTDDGAAVGAMNVKFARIGSGVRIRYRTKKGFEVVVEDE